MISLKQVAVAAGLTVLTTATTAFADETTTRNIPAEIAANCAVEALETLYPDEKDTVQAKVNIANDRIVGVSIETDNPKHPAVTITTDDRINFRTSSAGIRFNTLVPLEKFFSTALDQDKAEKATEEMELEEHDGFKLVGKMSKCAYQQMRIVGANPA